jgi:endonuclease/exonuclease/phosphatase family metal-dependent hydrolase
VHPAPGVPDYSKQPKTRRACWDWLLETAEKVHDRPFVLVGDFNTDPTYDASRCGDCIGRLADAGWQHQVPENPPSYRTPKGHGVSIDHAFVTSHFDLQRAWYVARAGAHVLAFGEGRLSDHAALVVELHLRT